MQANPTIVHSMLNFSHSNVSVLYLMTTGTHACTFDAEFINVLVFRKTCHRETHETSHGGYKVYS